jgi:hypothetical protein
MSSSHVAFKSGRVTFKGNARTTVPLSYGGRSCRYSYQWRNPSEFKRGIILNYCWHHFVIRAFLNYQHRRCQDVTSGSDNSNVFRIQTWHRFASLLASFRHQSIFELSAPTMPTRPFCVQVQAASFILALSFVLKLGGKI